MASAAPSKWMLRRVQTAAGASSLVSVKLERLELFLTKRLQMDGDFEELEFAVRRDAHWLKCGTMASSYSIETILGILEDEKYRDNAADDAIHSDARMQRLSEHTVEITCYEASFSTSKETIEESTDDILHNTHKDIFDCSKIHRGPHSEWIRQDLLSDSTSAWKAAETAMSSSSSSSSSHLWWIDLRSMSQSTSTGNNSPYETPHDNISMLPTQESVVNLFRSIFTPDHDVSPWTNTEQFSNQNCTRPNIVILAMYPHDTEARKNVEDVRVSDIAPSWFLHAKAKLDSLELSNDLGPALMSCSTRHNHPSMPATLWIFKKLGQRTCLFSERPEDVWHSKTNDYDKSMAKGCLWESFVEEKEELEGNAHPQEATSSSSSNPPEPSYRLLSPPYVNLHQAYANTRIPDLFSPHSIQIFTQDALSIPQWTPWPESVHYKTTSSSGTTMPWTVFPLCHCFPANVPENLTWVPATQAHVPNTCALLQELVGPLHLRTALFSQLAPHSVLEAHTGWADLANHVLRLHIPLVVPGDEEGKDLCGTWVDGCVETHSVGRPLLFDDSKIHRAFNYSDATRVVLILDLARPHDLPPGYAKGGHTDELDAFIQQMSMPK